MNRRNPRWLPMLSSLAKGEEYERYREKSRPVNASHPLKPLALYGKHEVLEGPAMEGAVWSFQLWRRQKLIITARLTKRPSNIASSRPTTVYSSLKGCPLPLQIRTTQNSNQDNRLGIRTTPGCRREPIANPGHFMNGDDTLARFQ